ncbi:unnamed protein product [Oikopleura dioica]|uniref:Uncharacterized protein n=1 Tax=Oikopleura dioica TaxID=34765 RepID=E4YX85_OIKDI|nr:unnamed protein product [Oikopleura dioica]
MANWLEKFRLPGFSRDRNKNKSTKIGEVHIHYHQAVPETAAHAFYGSGNSISMPTGYSGFPVVGFANHPNVFSTPYSNSQQNNILSSPGFSEASAFSSMPNLQMPKFESPFKKIKKEKKKRKVKIEPNFMPIPDCIVENDEEMPTEVDMQELWRTRRTSTMTRLAKSMHNLSMKDPEWEGFRTRNGHRYK